MDKKLLSKYDVVVTTTGNINVLDKFMLEELKTGCIVCNIGHFDNEIDVAYLKKYEWLEIKPGVHKIIKSKKNNYIILLAEGRLVNLALATGHPSRIMDGAFCNQVLAQIYLYQNGLKSNNREIYLKVLPKELDEEVAGLMVKGFGGTLTYMTEQQEKYTSIDSKGPFKKEKYKY